VPVTIVSACIPSMATERMRNAAKKSFSAKSMNTAGSPLSKSKEPKKWICEIRM